MDKKILGKSVLFQYHYPRFNSLAQRRQHVELVAACTIFIAGMAAYFPVLYIRKTNKMLQSLQKIEENTRK